MARIPRRTIDGEPTVYHVVSRTALDGFVLGEAEKEYLLTLIPREVYNEVVVNGLHLGATDAQAVAFFMQQGHIRMVDVAVPCPLPAWA